MPTDIPKLLQSITQEQNRVFEGIMTRLNSYTPSVIEKQFHERDIKSGAMQQLLDLYRSYQAENRTLLAMGNPEALNGLEDLKRQILAFNAPSAVNGASLEKIQQQASLGDQTMMGIIKQYSPVFNELQNPSPVNFVREGTNIFVQEQDGRKSSLVDSDYHKKVDIDQIKVDVEPIEYGARLLNSNNEYYSNYINTVNGGQAYTPEIHLGAVTKFVEDELKYQTTNFAPTYAQYSLNYLESTGKSIPSDPQELQQMLVDNAQEIKANYIYDLASSTYQQSVQANAMAGMRAFQGDQQTYDLAQSITTPNPDPSVSVGSNPYQDFLEKYSPQRQNDGTYTYSVATLDNVLGVDDQVINSSPMDYKQVNFGDPWSINENFDVHYQDGEFKDSGSVSGSVKGITSPIFAYIGNQKSDISLDASGKLFTVNKYEMMSDNFALSIMQQAQGNPLKDYIEDAQGNPVGTLNEVYNNMISDNLTPEDALALFETVDISPVRYAIVTSGSKVFHVPLDGDNEDMFYNQLNAQVSKPQEQFVLNSFDSLFNVPSTYINSFNQALQQATGGMSTFQLQQLGMYGLGTRNRPYAPPKAP